MLHTRETFGAALPLLFLHSPGTANPNPNPSPSPSPKPSPSPSPSPNPDSNPNPKSGTAADTIAHLDQHFPSLVPPHHHLLQHRSPKVDAAT